MNLGDWYTGSDRVQQLDSMTQIVVTVLPLEIETGDSWTRSDIEQRVREYCGGAPEWLDEHDVQWMTDQIIESLQ